MAPVPWSAAQKAAFLDDQFRLQHHHFVTHHPLADFWLLVGAGGSVAGRLYLDRSTPLWRIIDVGLAEDQRGKGLGGALLVWIKDQAAAAGAHGVDLHVARPNARARALYERLGFSAVDPPLHHHQRMEWRPDGGVN